jgi:hypothetical protein
LNEFAPPRQLHRYDVHLMTVSDVLKIAASILVSLGGAGAIVIGLSSWLGKVWANRIMAGDRAKHDRALEQLRAELLRANEEDLNKLKSELEVQRHVRIQEHQDKIAIYRLVADIVGDILADLDRLPANQPYPPDLDDRFNRQRMKAYGYLGMLAPQDVMDSYDRLIDYLIDVTGGTRPHEWSDVRVLIIDMINCVRADIGINKSPIEYRGTN